MLWSEIIHQVVEFGSNLLNYPFQLAGCVVLWMALLWLTRANRLSAFVFSFSAWFAILWALIIAFFVLSEPLERLDRFKLGSLAAMALPMVLFGFCAFSSLFSFYLVLPVEQESSRAVRLCAVLLFGHIIHVALIAMLTALSTP
jgi:hypothetical protein